MSLKFYFGPSGAGKTTQLHKDIIEMSMAKPDMKIFVITPDQYTMQTQRDIILSHPSKGMMDIEIISFSRLAYAVFEETGITDRIMLDDTGKNLILRKLAFQYKDQLKALATNIKKPGYIHEIKSVISEFMQYSISPDELAKIIESMVDRPALKERLKDLQLLYKAFMEEISDKYLTTEEKLSVLAEMISRTDMLKGSLVVFDGFTGFTPVQGQVISAIMEAAEYVWMTVTVDKEGLETDKIESSLFYLSRKTINYIEKLAKNAAIERDEDIYIFPETQLRLRNNPELSHLEKHLFRNHKDAFYDKEVDRIVVFSEDDPREELRRVARHIKASVAKGNKYQDMAVITADLERYAPYADEIFTAYGIPYFVDSTRHLSQNPFTEFIKSGLEVINSNFSYDAVVHFIRTGMTKLTLDEVDRLDNYLLARGVKGISKWKCFKAAANYMKEYVQGKLCRTDNTEKAMEDINAIRAKVMETLSPLLEFKATGQYKALKLAEALYSFIDRAEISEQLKAYSRKFEEEKDFARAKEYDQVYRKVLEVVEQIAELMGDDEIALEEFIGILEAGISEIKIGVLPVGMDYVPIGDIERTRLKEIKELYFLGVNDGVVPKAGSKGGLISDLDRDYLEKHEVELSPGPRESSQKQKLYLYMCLTKPKDMLYISYSKKDSQGKTIRPSYLIASLNKIYPKLTKEDAISLSMTDSLYSYADCNDMLSSGLRDYASGMEMDEKALSELRSIYEIVAQRDTNTAERIISEAFDYYDKTADNAGISIELIKALYGTVISNSISRLEKFASCAFKHFLDYGMKLEEREEAAFGRLDIGNLIHEVLMEFHYRLNEDGINWRNITGDEADKLIELILKEKAENYNENIISESARTAYQFTRLKRILTKTVMNMAYHLKKGSFNPWKAEVEFSEKLDIDGDVLIKGKIDRVDLAESEDSLYVKVVDYKSGNKEIDLISLYLGTQLQLVVYLDKAMHMQEKLHPDKKVSPAALFYYHVYDPVISLKEAVSEEEINRQLLEKMRDTGIFIEDREVLDRLDSEAFDNGSSDVINVKTGIPAKESERRITDGDGVNQSDFDVIMEYADYKVKELSKDMLSGNISMAPMDESTCKYCNYKDICSFDGKYINDDITIDKKNVVESMREKLQS